MQRAEPEARMDDHAVFWTISGGNDRLRTSLSLSILSVSRCHAAAALLVLHDGALDCAGLQLEGRVPCVALSRPRGLAPNPRIYSNAVDDSGCHVGEPLLRARSVHLVPMGSSADAAIDELRSCIASRKFAPNQTLTRADLVNGSRGLRGNNYRLFAAPLLLSLGVRKALYLDLDTRVLGSLGDIFGASDTAALVVANRSAPSTAMLRTAREFVAPTSLLHRWGFDSVTTQSFNAGVMLINTQPFCRAGLDTRALEVARYHRDVQPLFRREHCIA
jgi:hypothetical protein